MVLIEQATLRGLCGNGVGHLPVARLASSGCSTKFLDADVTGLLASASVIVDDGKKVFGSTESYIEHVVTGQELLKLRKSGVCVLQLDTQ